MVNKQKSKGTYWKLTPKRRKVEERRWWRNYYALNDKKDKIKLKDVSPICVMCYKEPVKWGIKVNDFVSDVIPEMDSRYVYCCSELCACRACSLISMGGVVFKERK